MLKKYRFLIAGLVVVTAIAFLAIKASQYSVLSMNVRELKAREPSRANEGVSLFGNVVGDSINNSPHDLVLKFDVVDEDGPKDVFLHVVYNGVMPDSFAADVQVIMEGKYNPAENLFTATTLLVKCPSRYEGEEAPGDYDMKSHKVETEGA